MYCKQNSSPMSPKNVTFIPRNTFTQQMNYKQRANVLFDKLNAFKTNLEIEKHSKFSQILKELKNIEDNLQMTSKDKQAHFQKLLLTISSIDKEINQQKIEFNRFKKVLQNLVDSSNRECHNIFDKMTKQRQKNQTSIQKFIDFKIESFVLKNKGVWLEQDLLNFEPFRQELNYLKKQTQQFYKNQQKEIEKLKRQVSDSLDKQKQFLLNEMKRGDHDDIMAAIQGVYSEIRKKVAVMGERRENVQKNVLSMIQNVINCYIKDSNKFR